MAVSAIPATTDLILVMDNGFGASGQQLSVNRIYKDVKTSADNEKMYSVAQNLISLQESVNLSIQRRDVSELEND